MAMRISGIASGLDTDSMVQELVKASSKKKEDLEKAQTKLGWQQEVWKEFNTKVYNFYNNQLTNMMLESSFNKKKTTVSDSNIASVIAGTDTANGTQTLAVKQLAKTGSLTGGKLSDDKSVTGKTTLAELIKKNGGTLSDTAEISFRVMNGGKETTISLSGKSTINDVMEALRGTGLTANFDETNQRIFINAGGSGAENDFTITGSDVEGLTALSSMGLLNKSDFEPGSAAYENYQYWGEAFDNVGGTYQLNEAKFQEKLKETTAKEVADMLKELDTYKSEVQRLREERTKLTSEKDKVQNLKDSEEAQKKLADAANVLRDYYQSVIDDYDTNGAASGISAEELQAARDGRMKAVEAYTVAESAAKSMDLVVPPTTASYDLASKVEQESRAYAAAANMALHDPTLLSGASSNSVRVQGQDAIISLNGADFTSDSNHFTINGLNITANAVSAITGKDADGNNVYAESTISTSDDVDGIYDMVKNFFKEYNALIKEMDTLYNAKTAKGYEPLTDDEKDAMSDTEVEKWETKIKDSLLRRDSDLGTLIQTFKTAMLGSVTIDGKKYSLSNFGINTLGYFKSGDNEKGVFHIDGDKDDTNTSGEEDKLKAAIASDPETVKKFFTELIGGLQKQVNGIMQRTDYRSIYNVYDNKRMQVEYDEYTEKIKKQEKKLQALEDRYYKQFTTMETAMSKLNSQQSYISSLFGN